MFSVSKTRSKPRHWTRKVPKSPSPFRWIDGLKTFSCCKMGNASGQIESTKDGPCFLPTFPPPSKKFRLGFSAKVLGGVVGISKKVLQRNCMQFSEKVKHTFHMSHILDDVLIYWCIYSISFYIIIRKHIYILRLLHITVYRTFARVALGRVAVLLGILAYTGIVAIQPRTSFIQTSSVFFSSEPWNFPTFALGGDKKMPLFWPTNKPGRCNSK